MIKTYLRVLENGQHVIEKEESFNKRLMALAVGLHVVIIETARNSRSNKQNGYYWAVVLGAYQEGYNEVYGTTISKDEAHYNLKRELHYEFLTNPVTGESIKIGKTTTEDDTKEFSEYTNQCRLWISEWFGIETPDPDPMYKSRRKKS